MPSPLARVDRETARRALVLAAITGAARAKRVSASWSPEPWQRPPAVDEAWTNWLLLGGRGSGKTAAGAAAMNDHANGPACLQGRVPHRMALVAATNDDAVDTCINGETGLRTLNPSIKFSPGSRLVADLTWPNKSEATYFGCFGPEDVERFRGPQFCFEWYDELAAWRKLDDAWPMLDLGLRLGPKPRRVITTTPKPRKRLKMIIADPATLMTQVSTSDNPHLPEARRAEFYKVYGGTTLGRRELDAEMMDDMEGALWKRDQIEDSRRTKAPDLVRVVVAIDPAVTSEEGSDETGIVVAGIDGADPPHGYVLDDKSGRFAPMAWARRAIGVYKDRDADRVIGETNNGGDLVELTLRTVDKNVSYKKVTASRGKRTRAEPIAALYEQGRIHHVGTFPELEDQQCTWMPGDPSPDRMDALVWALTELLVETSSGVLDYYRQAQQASASQEAQT